MPDLIWPGGGAALSVEADAAVDAVLQKWDVSDVESLRRLLDATIQERSPIQPSESLVQSETVPLALPRAAPHSLLTASATKAQVVMAAPQHMQPATQISKQKEQEILPTRRQIETQQSQEPSGAQIAQAQRPLGMRQNPRPDSQQVPAEHKSWRGPQAPPLAQTGRQHEPEPLSRNRQVEVQQSQAPLAAQSGRLQKLPATQQDSKMAPAEHKSRRKKPQMQPATQTSRHREPEALLEIRLSHATPATQDAQVQQLSATCHTQQPDLHMVPADQKSRRQEPQVPPAARKSQVPRPKRKDEGAPDWLREATSCGSGKPVQQEQQPLGLAAASMLTTASSEPKDHAQTVATAAAVATAAVQSSDASRQGPKRMAESEAAIAAVGITRMLNVRAAGEECGEQPSRRQPSRRCTLKRTRRQISEDAQMAPQPPIVVDSLDEEEEEEAGSNVTVHRSGISGHTSSRTRACTRKSQGCT